MTRTITGTQTYARFSLLEMQVRAMLRDAAGITSTTTLDKVSKGLREPHYVEQIVVKGCYPHGTIGAQMCLIIDWRTHSIELQSGGDAVRAPSSWENGIAPSVEEGVRTFLEACETAGLEREWGVVYGRQYDIDYVNGILGFRRAKPRRWEREPDSVTMALGPLSEGSIVISLAL